LPCSEPPQEIVSHTALLAAKGRSRGLSGARFCRQVSLWRGCTGAFWGPKGALVIELHRKLGVQYDTAGLIFS
jgi:hypothetical protein